MLLQDFKRFCRYELASLVVPPPAAEADPPCRFRAVIGRIPARLQAGLHYASITLHIRGYGGAEHGHFKN
jgi:hypothetical protein